MKPNSELNALFNERKAAIERLQTEIAEMVRSYGTDEPINWGHAGSLGHVVEQLQEIHEFLRG